MGARASSRASGRPSGLLQTRWLLSGKQGGAAKAWCSAPQQPTLSTGLKIVPPEMTLAAPVASSSASITLVLQQRGWVWGVRSS